MKKSIVPLVTLNEQAEQDLMFEKATAAAQAIYKDAESGYPTGEEGFRDIVKKKWAYLIMTEFYDWRM